MAVLSKIAPSTATRKGAGIRNFGRAWLDIAASPLEGIIGTDITNLNYEGGNADKWEKFSQVGSAIGKGISHTVVGSATGSMGNAAQPVMNSVGGMGDMIPQPSMDATGTYIAKYGGKVLTEYKGNTHEFGGIPIDANNEVEDKENSFDMKDGGKYIFSNSIIMPNKKHTFAQGAKRIASKYKLRDGDTMAKTAQQRELEQLSQKQELVKEIMKTPVQRMQEQMQQFAMGGFLGDPPAGTPVNQATIDSNLIKANALQPKQAVKPVTGGVRFLPNGDIIPYNALKEPEYVPPTPEEIAKVMAEAEAQAKVQAQLVQKKYGGYSNTMFDDGGKYKFKPFYNPGQDIGELPQYTPEQAQEIMQKNIWSTPRYRDRHSNSQEIVNYITTGNGINKNEVNLGYPIDPLGGFGQPRFNTETPINVIKPKGLNTKATPLTTLQKGTTPAYKQSMLEAAIKNNPFTSDYKPAYGVPMAGYAAQALSNLPALFAKPNKVKFDRIRPETIDLSSQRDEARRNRNLQIAMAQRQAAQMDNAGQAGAYANAATSGIIGSYGDAFNQSIMQQNNTNVGIKNQAKTQNAETQMREAIVNQQELNAIREGKQQAISNIGTTAAMAGNTYQQMERDAEMMDWLKYSNPDYTWSYDSNGKLIPTRKRTNKYGGKIRRAN